MGGWRECGGGSNLAQGSTIRPILRLHYFPKLQVKPLNPPDNESAAPPVGGGGGGGETAGGSNRGGGYRVRVRARRPITERKSSGNGPRRARESRRKVSLSEITNGNMRRSREGERARIVFALL